MSFFEKVEKFVEQENIANGPSTRIFLLRADVTYQLILLERLYSYDDTSEWAIYCVYKDHTDKNGINVFNMCMVREFDSEKEAKTAFNALTE